MVGTERRPSRRGRRTAVLLSTVLLVGAFGLDRWQERREVDALLRCVTSAQADAVYADRRILAAVQYTSPLLFRPSVPASLRASLEGLVQAAARETAPPLRVSRAACAAGTVLAWHDAQRRARTRYLAYLDVRIDDLRGVGADIDVLFAPHPDLERRLTVARDAVLAAVPLDRAQRVRELLSP